jgi:uncharacterized protein (DUF58 family)
MIPTFRAVLLLLGAAPLIAAATWAPALQGVAALYVVASLALLLLDRRWAGDPARFEVEREHEPRLSLGADNAVRIRVRNRSPRPATVWVRDEAPDAFEVDEVVLEGEIPPRGTWEGVYRVRPSHRGDYRFGDSNLRWLGPLRLVARQAAFPKEEGVKVYPNLLDVSRYDLLLRRNRLEELGLRRSRVFGQGTEFEQLREYLPDDDFRRIDWKATARRNRPVTTEYQTERSQNVVAVLDTGRMMGSRVKRMAKLDHVINAVLLLGYVATGKGDKVGLMTFADDVQQFLAPRHGRGQFYRMLEALYAVEPQGVEPDYRRALSYLALKQRKRSLVVIFTDVSGGLSLQTLVNHLSVLARRSLPLVVTISDPDVHAVASGVPADSAGVYRRAAAGRLLDERRVVLDRLRHQGVLTLDVPADELSLAVVNRYLELKGRRLL